jgi:Tfp pilus assembly protein PilV
MTVVELLVAMFVTSVILVGLTGVFLNVSNRYQEWANRIQNASTGANLAAALQSDSHRYVPCGNVDHVSVFQMCPADDRANWAVEYVVAGTFPYVITREEAGKAPTLMARSVNPTPPSFWAECIDNGITSSGHIHVYNLRIDDGAGGTSVSSENFSVYYVGPWRPAC